MPHAVFASRCTRWGSGNDNVTNSRNHDDSDVDTEHGGKNCKAKNNTPNLPTKIIPTKIC